MENTGYMHIETENEGPKPCPSCGHCPTCGHTPQRMSPPPWNPWYIPTYPIQPYTVPFWYANPNGTNFTTNEWTITTTPEVTAC